MYYTEKTTLLGHCTNVALYEEVHYHFGMKLYTCMLHVIPPNLVSTPTTYIRVIILRSEYTYLVPGEDCRVCRYDTCTEWCLLLAFHNTSLPV